MGILSMLSLSSMSTLLRLQGVSTHEIGWFVAIGSLPWGLRFLYAKYIEKYRKKSLAKTQIIALFGVGMALICCLSYAFIEFKSSIIILTTIVFISNVCLTFSDIALSGLAIDKFSHTLRSWLNGCRVVFSALSAAVSGGVFFLVLASSSQKNAIFAVVGISCIIALPLFLLIKAKIDLKDNLENKPSVLAFFKNKLLRVSFLLLLFAQFSTALQLFLGGTFLADKGLNEEQIGVVFGTYSVVASIFGGIVGAYLNAKLGGRKSFILFLGLETLSFIALFFISNYEVEKLIVVIIFCLSSLIVNAKFVSLYTLAMHYSKSSQSGLNFSIYASGLEILPSILSIPGGYIIASFGWNYLFVICFALGCLSFLTFVCTKEKV